MRNNDWSVPGSLARFSGIDVQMKGLVIMIKKSFCSLDHSAKAERIRQIIMAKANGISENHVCQIMDVVEFDRQYTITATGDISRFLQNAYNEDGGELFQVTVDPIYGDMAPGLSTEDGCMEYPSCTDQPAAFLKTAVISLGKRIEIQNSIFIYQKQTA